ncbi:MAG: capsular polysaccharide biosynthesis protein [Planctomycetota bacterium]|jgi:capsular polysaccharide biosynthesis protein
MKLFDDQRDSSFTSVLESKAAPSVIVVALLRARHHWLIFVVVSLCLAFVGTWAVAKKFKPSYRAETKLHVAALAPRVLFANEEWHKESIVGFYDDFVRTISQQAKSERVLIGAIQILREEEVHWIPSTVLANEVVAHLRARLQVARIRDTYLLSISMDDSTMAWPAPIANAVGRSLLDELRRLEVSEGQRLMKALQDEKVSMELELTATYGQLDGLSARLGSAILDERQNIFYERIQVLEQGLTKVFVKRVAAEGALKSARGRATELLGPVPAGDLEEELCNDVRVKDVRVMARRRISQIEDQMMGLGAEHPHTNILKSRIFELGHETSVIVNLARKEIKNRIASQRTEEAKRITNQAERDLASVIESEKSMKVVLVTAKSDLVDYGRAMFEGSKLRAKSKRLLNAIDDVGTRIMAVKIEGTAPSRIRMHEEARTPTKPISDKRALMRSLAIIIALLFGLIASIGMGFVRQMRQRGVSR